MPTDREILEAMFRNEWRVSQVPKNAVYLAGTWGVSGNEYVGTVTYNHTTPREAVVAAMQLLSTK